MTRVLSASVAFPTREISQSAMEREMPRWLLGRTPHAEKVLRILGRSGVETRRMVVPLAELFRLGELGERNRSYIRHAKELALDVARAEASAERELR